MNEVIAPANEFAEDRAELSALALRRRIAVMRAESVWWRCHRRFLADHLVLIEELSVEHLFHHGEDHRIQDRLVYCSPSSQPAASMPARRK